MANGNVEVKKYAPCHICGGPDWCSRYTSNEGYEMSCCKRSATKSGFVIPTNLGEGVLGSDGEYYIRVGTSGSGNGIFMNAKDKIEEDRRKKEEWLALHGKKLDELVDPNSEIKVPLNLYGDMIKERRISISREQMEEVFGQFERYYAGQILILLEQKNICNVDLYFHKGDKEYYVLKYKEGYVPVSNGVQQKTVRTEPIVVDEVKPLSNEECDKISRAMIKHLVLEECDRTYLMSEGWTDEMIERYHVRTFPEKDASRFKYRKESFKTLKTPSRKKLARLVMDDLRRNDLLGYPGAFLQNEEENQWSFAGPGGIIFFLPDYSGHYLYRARIRMNYRDVAAVTSEGINNELVYSENGIEYHVCYKGVYHYENGEKVFRKDILKGKYRPLHSYHEDEEALKQNRIVNAYKKGCASGNALGFFMNSQTDDMHICYITEGEKKAAFANCKLKAPFISVPGVDSFTLLFKEQDGVVPVDKLKEEGVSVLIVAYDADKEQNLTVLDREKKTVDALKAAGFMVGVAEWNVSVGKGIDDLLANGGKPRYVCM